MLTIQPSFQGKTHYIGKIEKATKNKISQTLNELQFNQKPFDLFISQTEVAAQRAEDKTNKIAPRFSLVMNPKKDSFEFAVRSAIENFEIILNNLKA